MNSDFRELLQVFAEHDVRYLIVGGYAVSHHSQPRLTKDLDLWIEPTTANAARVAAALRVFGIPLRDVTEEDFASPGLQFAVGRSPTEIDFLTTVPGLEFTECWPRRDTVEIEGVTVDYLGRADLIIAKRTAARQIDLADLEELERGDP